MANLTRLSFSIERSLETKLEDLVRRAGYGNRSEYIRDLIRDRLVEQEWSGGDEAVGTITLVYDHHARGVAEKLTELQHHHHDVVLAATHVHLDEKLCAEVVICRGRPAAIRAIADRLRQQRGVLHGTLSMSSTGARLVE